MLTSFQIVEDTSSILSSNSFLILSTSAFV
nr:MAG TPA: hypothetical protein [Bacteriophage sp.]